MFFSVFSLWKDNNSHRPPISPFVKTRIWVGPHPSQKTQVFVVWRWGGRKAKKWRFFVVCLFFCLDFVLFLFFVLLYFCFLLNRVFVLLYVVVELFVLWELSDQRHQGSGRIANKNFQKNERTKERQEKDKRTRNENRRSQRKRQRSKKETTQKHKPSPKGADGMRWLREGEDEKRRKKMKCFFLFFFVFFWGYLFWNFFVTFLYGTLFFVPLFVFNRLFCWFFC